jgi:hypothetical protein
MKPKMTTRIMLAVAGAMIGMAALAQDPAQASEQPWCMDHPWGVPSCQYSTYEQCRQAGSRAICMQNPRWPGWWEQRTRDRGRR